MQQAASTFDFILDTVPVKHNFDQYVSLLDIDGSLVLVGQIGPMEELMTPPLVMGRRRIAGSLIGGIAETQEVLNFCAEHNIHPECKMIPINEINEAWDNLTNGNPAYRYVIDMSSLSL